MEATGVNLKLVLVGKLHVGRSAIVERYMTGTLSDDHLWRSYFYDCGLNRLGV